MSAVQDEADEGHENITENITEEHDSDELHNEANGLLESETVREINGEDGSQDETYFVEEVDGREDQGFKRRQKRAQIDSSDAPPIPPVLERPSSADGSFSIPDDTPSVQGSLASSPGRGGRLASYSRSPTPSARAFDRRFIARLPSSSLIPARVASPAFLNNRSRQSSVSHSIPGASDEEVQAPWEVVRWAKLRRMTGQAFSEIGKRQFGRPTCIAVSTSIIFGTSKGIILVFDYNQNLKSIIGPGTKAVESGSVTSISISADHSTIAGGHASGNIFTWEVVKPAKPFLHIPPVDRSRTPGIDGHVLDVAILHIGFLGIRHTALTSADDKGMGFSHLATRGLGVVARSVKTTRILGRYPDNTAIEVRQKKPSSVLAFSPLPLGNAEHAADSMGLVAMLTPYLLVVVSTMPIAQTQYKTPRPKEVAAHGAMTAALAWFPSVKLRTQDPASSTLSSKVKLVYCWSNILTVLDVIEIEASEPNEKAEPPTLQFKPRSRWKAQEAIVGVQWLSRSVIAVLTITQQLIILEDDTMIVTDSSDLIQKHIYHEDLFSGQLNQLVDQLEDEEVAAMHGVVADAFYMSFRAYKGRLFLLGFNEVSFGTLSNWADRLLALMEDGNYIGAIRLATGYYTGETDRVTVGLPEDDSRRHQMVQEKLSGMILASLKYCLHKKDPNRSEIDVQQLGVLATDCITACIKMDDFDLLFDEVYPWYQEGTSESVFLEKLEPFINSEEISTLPPSMLKDLVQHYTARDLNSQLEEIICHLDPHTMDIDQITALCKKNRLYDALLYVWNQGLGDYTTLLNDLLELGTAQHRNGEDVEIIARGQDLESAAKIFPYTSYILTGRTYPTGKAMPDSDANAAKADIYHFLFSGNSNDKPRLLEAGNLSSYPNLRRILDFDASSFLSMLNEAFEDSFLNGPSERMANGSQGQRTEEQKFGLSVNRQWIVSILLEVMTPPSYGPDETIYLDMFVARNLPKFPQFILLPGHVLNHVLMGLCKYPTDDIAEDCQLSVEYLLSMYQPPDLTSLIPHIHEARFYRVLKAIYKTEKQYAKLLQICFEDYENPDAVFDCISDCLRPGVGLSEKQLSDFRGVVVEHAHDLVAIDVTKAASTTEKFMPDLHETLLVTLDDDEPAQYIYLRTFLDPADRQGESDRLSIHQPQFLEQFVRLLCEYDPSRVSQYIDQLKVGDLRLERILPALEEGGAIDAAVVLMVREGEVRRGIDRLTQQLHTLEFALHGLLESLNDSPDMDNTMEAGKDMVASILKYARVGIWICRSQTKSSIQSKPTLSRSQSMKSMNDNLSGDEELWLDLIDSVVTVTKNITEVLEHRERLLQTSENEIAQSEAQSHDTTKMVTDLRTVVQETFTALLTATTPPRTADSKRTDLSFLRILRAFLNRASLSSPSLSNLRAVLAAIFSAYSYEESLLALSNRLLDKDLFVHVTEADTLRRRGWRPLGQACEACGRRTWGPGAGAYIWEAWQRQNVERGRQTGNKFPPRSSSRASSIDRKGKGVVSRRGSTSDDGEGNDRHEGGAEHRGAIVIFSCRHLFHRSCLERMMRGREGDQLQGQGRVGSTELACPLE